MLLITCEHGGKEIPRTYRSLFRNAQSILNSHRGYDPGTLEMARRLAKHFQAPLVASATSRLLVELNRSLGHPRLFSEFTRRLPAAERDQLIAEYYEPHRESVIQTVQRLGRTGPVLHVGVHSFTPVLKGRTRRTDIGLLFDPRRKFESAVCQAWRQALRDLAPELKVHFNLPYRGVSDGLTTALRTHFPDERYAGVELEVNQKFPLGERRAWKQLQQTLQASLTETMKSKMI